MKWFKQRRSTQLLLDTFCIYHLQSFNSKWLLEVWLRLDSYWPVWFFCSLFMKSIRKSLGSQDIFRKHPAFLLALGGWHRLASVSSPVLYHWTYHQSNLPKIMMTSSNGNIFRVTGHFCDKFTGHRWIPCTKASDLELWHFLWSAPEWTIEQKQSRGWWFETPSCPLWRHNNDGELLYNESMLTLRGRGTMTFTRGSEC